eukprot:scaffold2257_cov169-Amphora_coffeaeformis.AAC.9
MTTKEQVAAMAYSTGERLKSSAVELFRGLESSLQNREQMEVAFAKMFGSCTGNSPQQPPSRVPSALSNSSFGDSHAQQQRNTLGAAPLRRGTSHTTSSSRRNKKKNESSSSKASRKNNKRTDSGDSSSGSSSASSRRRERRQTRADYGEHIYAQLFMDDQKRAAQAVHTLRESAVARAPPAPTPVTPGTATNPTKKTLFPISSPPRQTEQPAKIAPLSSDHLHIPATLTFDDGISAISQHTLEAMEDRVNRTRSTDSSLWSCIKESKTPPLAPAVRTPSPLTMSRVRSAQSKASRQSRTSHTTHTSDSSSFHNMWQKEEQKYWNTQVKQEPSRKSSSRKSRSNSVQKTADNTLSTFESSFDDVWGSPMRHHPHDASPLARDPDRIGAVFMVPNTTEMGEI